MTTVSLSGPQLALIGYLLRKHRAKKLKAIDHITAKFGPTADTSRERDVLRLLDRTVHDLGLAL